MNMIGNPRMSYSSKESLYWQKFFFFKVFLIAIVHYNANIMILWPSSRRTLMQCMILQCMILLAGILCISSILQVVKQRNGDMGRKHLLHCKPSRSPSWYSSWSYSLFIIAFVISFLFIFVSFSNMEPKGRKWEQSKVWFGKRKDCRFSIFSIQIEYCWQL